MVAKLVRVTVDISGKGLELGMYVQEGQVRDGSYSGRRPQLGCWGLALLAGVLAQSRLHTVLVVREHPLQQERAPQTVAKHASFQEREGRVWGDPRRGC